MPLYYKDSTGTTKYSYYYSDTTSWSPYCDGTHFLRVLVGDPQTAGYVGLIPCNSAGTVTNGSTPSDMIGQLIVNISGSYYRAAVFAKIVTYTWASQGNNGDSAGVAVAAGVWSNYQSVSGTFTTPGYGGASGGGGGGGGAAWSGCCCAGANTTAAGGSSGLNGGTNDNAGLNSASAAAVISPSSLVGRTTRIHGGTTPGGGAGGGGGAAGGATGGDGSPGAFPPGFSSGNYAGVYDLTSGSWMAYCYPGSTGITNYNNTGRNGIYNGYCNTTTSNGGYGGGAWHTGSSSWRGGGTTAGYATAVGGGSGYSGVGTGGAGGDGGGARCGDFAGTGSLYANGGATGGSGRSPSTVGGASLSATFYLTGS